MSTDPSTIFTIGVSSDIPCVSSRELRERFLAASTIERGSRTEEFLGLGEMRVEVPAGHESNLDEDLGGILATMRSAFEFPGGSTLVLLRKGRGRQIRLAMAEHVEAAFSG